MQTMGLSGLAQHEPGLGEVLISIGSPGERMPDECACYADVLRVEFDDDQFEGWEQRRRNLKGMDAGRIVRFVLQHRNTAPRLTIHCAAGASRSVSIAEGIAAALGIPHPRSVILNYGAYFGVYDAAQRIMREQSRLAALNPPTESTNG
jgi:predicted protein tyrosine phosphatase